jgi:ketosteroid isomerase-like protein
MVGLSACEAPSQKGGHMNENANTDLVRSGYEKFSKGDIPGLLSLFSDDIDWFTPHLEDAPYGGRLLGLKALGEFFQTLGEAEEFSFFEPTEYIAQGDRVVVLGRSKATVRSTNRSYEIDWVQIFTVHEGKVTNFAEYFDSALVNKAFQKAAGA